MATILLVAHAPLATSLRDVARHAYSDCGASVGAVDVPADASLDAATALVAASLQRMSGAEVLVLADAFGATPCNAALRAADGVHVRVVAGVNVPMLWRTLCYGNLPLEELVTRAVDGGRQGIMHVGSSPQQNQPKPPSSDDSDPNPDQ
jgi:PTS system ascorbate-specific IIA component